MALRSVNECMSKLRFYSLTYLLKRGTSSKLTYPIPQGVVFDKYHIYLTKRAEPQAGNGDGLTQAVGDDLCIYLDEDDGLIGRSVPLGWDNESGPATHITPEMLEAYSVKVRHFYRNCTFSFDGLFKPFVQRIIRAHKFRYRLISLGRWWYRKRFKAIDDRLRILREVVELQDAGAILIGAEEICRKLYGASFEKLEPERYRAVINQTKRLLDSLVALNALNDHSEKYSYTSSGINMLVEWPKELREQRSERFYRRITILLTLILALSSSLMAYFSYLAMEAKPF